MATTNEMLASTFDQFPQPTRPLHVAYETKSDSFYGENRIRDQYFAGCDDAKEDWMSEYENSDEDRDHEDLMQILSGLDEEVDEGRGEMVKKLFAKVKKDVPIRKIFRKTLHEFGTRPISEVFENLFKKFNSGDEENDAIVMQRGVDDLFGTEENRLERFKVKTVNIPGVGVVKEEEEGQS